MNDKVFSSSERIIFALRELYLRYGYSPYRMSKFEEYDLYSRNKDFLISDSVITFTDTNGRLMALKPDVTLSIIKNNRGLSGETRKLFYNENVYRVAKGANSFREIMQAGVECIGDIDSYLIGESLYLAAESLNTVSEAFVLNISSLDILLSFVDHISAERAVRDEIIKCVREKNIHGVYAVCRENGIDESMAEPLRELLSVYGAAADALPRIKQLSQRVGAEDAVAQLEQAVAVFGHSPVSERIQLDFSVVSDINYYNGIIFKGYVNGVPGAVLSGGQYDKLMQKMHRKSRAVGFAVYLDMLERLGDETEDYDADILLVYGDNADPAKLIRKAQEYMAQGHSVYVTKDAGAKIKYRQRYDDTEGEKI